MDAGLKNLGWWGVCHIPRLIHASWVRSGWLCRFYFKFLALVYTPRYVPGSLCSDGDAFPVSRADKLICFAWKNVLVVAHHNTLGGFGHRSHNLVFKGQNILVEVLFCLNDGGGARIRAKWRLKSTQQVLYRGLWLMDLVDLPQL